MVIFYAWGWQVNNRPFIYHPLRVIYVRQGRHYNQEGPQSTRNFLITSQGQARSKGSYMARKMKSRMVTAMQSGPSEDD